MWPHIPDLLFTESCDRPSRELSATHAEQLIDYRLLLVIKAPGGRRWVFAVPHPPLIVTKTTKQDKEKPLTALQGLSSKSGHELVFQRV